MTARCPCCGHEMAGEVPAEALASVTLPPNQKRLLDVLVTSFPRPVPTFRQVDAVWGDRADGGPDGNIPKHLAVLAFRINERIRPLGWQVRGRLDRTVPGRLLVPTQNIVKETLTPRSEGRASTSRSTAL